MNSSKILILGLTNLLAGFSAQAKHTDTISSINTRPIFRIQYAGNMGLVSIGVDKPLRQTKRTLGVNYGYLPKDVNGVEVHTFGLRSTIRLWRISTFKSKSILNQYIGYNLTYSHTHNTYVEYPGYIPKGYHIPNAIHINPMFGFNSSIPVKKLSSFFVYIEFGTVDTKLWYAIVNRYIHLEDIMNICFGAAYQLK